MCLCATQIFGANFFMSYCLNDIGTRYKHVRSFLYHENKISKGRRINSTTSARSHNNRDLRDNPRCPCITEENVGISRERNHTFLNSSPTRIIDANNWSAILHSHVHQATNFCCMRFRQRTPKNCKVLGKHIN